MTNYGVLRLWAAVLTIFGVLGLVAAAAGTLIWAIEVDGFWETIGVLLVGGSVSLFFATFPIAVAQALRALADVGDTVSAR
jgi:hypothetical protein